MKSLSRIRSSALSIPLEAWNISDLDIEENVMPADTQTEHILSLFDASQRGGTSRSNQALNRPLHSNGEDVPLATWLPDDLDHQIDDVEPAQWDFVAPSNDFFNIPEQQILMEKLEAEKERVEIIKDARSQADAILHQARMQAEEIILHANDEIHQAKRNGYESARGELREALAATRAMIEETGQWQSSFMESGEQILVGMLQELAQTMFGEGVHLDANALQLNLNRVMESAQRLGELKIFLNPEDAAQLDPSWSDYQLLITGNKVRIVPSERILPGGCFIKGSTGMVDARVETQLSAVLNTITEVSEAGR